jgi:hypothetical protein
MGDTQEHVTAWQAAGLIDAATADRIRAFQPSASTSPATERAVSPFNAMFGPSLTIGEVFSYLGAAFVLAASNAFLVRIAGPAPSNDWVLAIGAAIQAVVLLAIGQWMRTGDRRRNRAAGVMFLGATVYAGIAAGLAAGAIGLEWPVSGVVGSMVALAVGVGTRIIHPSLLTQAAVLGAVTSVSATTLAWAQSVFFPEPEFSAGTTTTCCPATTSTDEFFVSGADPLVLVLAPAAWWLATALIIGLIGLREAARSDEDEGAPRRAGVTRFWAGIVAVVGFTMAITRGAFTPNGEYARIIEPWVADLAVLVLALILVQRAFRRDDSAFVYPAALAMIIALTDFNVSYLGGATELGLLVEGLILLAVGFGAQRVRRMVGGRGEPGTSPPAPVQDVVPEA